MEEGKKMSIFSKHSEREKEKKGNVNGTLKQAFRLGESTVLEQRMKAINLYKDILKKRPEMCLAWFNMGIVQSRVGDKQEAMRSFRHAKDDSSLALVAAYAILLLAVEMDQFPSDDDLPQGFQGGWGELGVQGPCQNAANWLRCKGCICTVESKGKSSMIDCHTAEGNYIIGLNDVFGSLIRNVYKKQDGKEINLGDLKVLSDIERELMALNVGRLPLMQAPVPQAAEPGIRRVPDASQESENGSRRWARVGHTFDEKLEQNKMEAKQSGTELVQIVSIEDIAKLNRVAGTFLAFCLYGEPHALAMPNAIDDGQIPALKRSVEGGFCFFRAGFYKQPEFPLVHIGLALSAESTGGARTSNNIIVENVANFTEANFQDWVKAIEAKQQTQIDVVSPDGHLIASGKACIDAQIISDIVKSVDKADELLKTIPRKSQNYNAALEKFYKEHPEPFI